MGSDAPHWERVYQPKNFDSVSWYTPHLKTSLSIINELKPDKTKSLIDIGGGESTLLDDLILQGHLDLSLIDISTSAVSFLKNRLVEHSHKIKWHTGDITEYSFLDEQFDFWHDRAVFHFLTKAESRQRYTELLSKSIKKGGHVLIATFSDEGPLKCSGLTVERYSVTKLSKELGYNFKLVGSKIEKHHTPFNTTQEFLYCWFRRT